MVWSYEFVDGTIGDTTARLRATAVALGWLAVGMLTVSAGYGFLAVLLGDRLPQLSEDVLANGMPERLVQSSVVFGLIGAAFGYLGLAALGAVPDPFAGRPPGAAAGARRADRPRPRGPPGRPPAGSGAAVPDRRGRAFPTMPWN